MSFGNILGQILQDGLGGQTQTRERVSTTARNLGAGGGGLDSIFGQLQNALGGGAQAGGAGGFADKAREFIQKDQVGGLSGAQIGGIGAAAGALLGGGIGGAARGGVMAVLGTLALGALKNARAKAEVSGPGGTASGEINFDPTQVKALVGVDSERLALKAMISAAKADGQIEKAEMERIIGKLSDDSVTEEEKNFVMAELRAPIDVNALAAAVTSPAQAAQVYAASILAVDIDSDKERSYLQQLAQALRLNPATVQQLHQMTGAPA